MKLFKKKENPLLKRLESLESELGYFYVVDSDDYAEHKLEEHGYGRVPKLDQRVKALEDEKKGKK